mgnify:FL=1
MQNLINAVLSTIAETPEGAPGGILYAGLMTKGLTSEGFQIIQTFVVSAGLVDIQNDLWIPTPRLLTAYAAAKAATK